MINWQEPLPGFVIPKTFPFDVTRWPDYTDVSVEERLKNTPELTDILRLRGWGQPSRKAWGAWHSALLRDAPLKRGWPDLEMIADKTYDTARYKFMVPAWRRAITDVIGDLDDIEDQISTILWIAETVSKKWIPLPKGLLNKADQVRKTFDCAERVLGGITPFRGTKSEYTNCLKNIAKQKQAARAQKAGLIAWFRENWGRLLEAAQATGTWFDVGIVLGPIMGFIEEGLYGLAVKTTDNYLIAIDAFAPGYREDFHRNARELNDAVEAVLSPLLQSATHIDLDKAIAAAPVAPTGMSAYTAALLGLKPPTSEADDAPEEIPAWLTDYVAP